MVRYKTGSTLRAAARMCLRLMLACATFAGQLAPALADEPGRGLTAQFEINFLQFTIDHHFAALRMTELAAGTDATRDAQISPNEGTSPSPNFASTPAKATLDEIKSLARRNNRAQREEILTAQRFLRQWYNINYQPRIRALNRAQIELLEHAAAGDNFNHLFLEVFSRHHFTLSQRALECLVASELRHKDLERLCFNMLTAQVSDIDEMRNLLCRQFQICDYQPLEDPKGRHSGDEDEVIFARMAGGGEGDKKP